MNNHFRSKKLYLAIFAILMIALIAYFVTDSVIATSAISAISVLGSIYLGGQSGIDTMHKYKNPERNEG